MNALIGQGRVHVAILERMFAAYAPSICSLCTLTSTDTLETFPPSTSGLCPPDTFESVTFVKPLMSGTSGDKGFPVDFSCNL